MEENNLMDGVSHMYMGLWREVRRIEAEYCDKQREVRELEDKIKEEKKQLSALYYILDGAERLLAAAERIHDEVSAE